SRSPSVSTQSNAVPLLLTASFKYRVFQTGEGLAWPVAIKGGTPPYTVTVDRGDKTSSQLSLPDARTFYLDYAYNLAGDYVIHVNARDKVGDTTTLQLVAIVKGSPVPGASSTGAITSGQSSGSFNWLIVAWPAYVTVVLMAISFWLGERQELVKL